MEDGRQKPIVLFLLTILLALFSWYLGGGGLNLWSGLLLWLYGLPLIFLIAIAATRKSPMMQAIFLSFGLAYIWGIIVSSNQQLINSFFVYAILLVLSSGLVFRDRMENM